MNNFISKGTLNGEQPIQEEFDVAAGTASSILEGDILNLANGYAVKVADGGGVSTGTKLFGLAVSTSTETAGVAGKVQAIYSPAGLVVEGTATTPANLATALKFDKVTIDVSGAVQTVDENDTSNGGILLKSFVGTDYTTTGKVQVVIPFQTP